MQNDILLPNLLDENGEMMGYENCTGEILANEEILENLNERERMIGGEIRFGEPNWWSGRQSFTSSLLGKHIFY